MTLFCFSVQINDAMSVSKYALRYHTNHAGIVHTRQVDVKGACVSIASQPTSFECATYKLVQQSMLRSGPLQIKAILETLRKDLPWLIHLKNHFLKLCSDQHFIQRFAMVLNKWDDAAHTSPIHAASVYKMTQPGRVCTGLSLQAGVVTLLQCSEHVDITIEPFLSKFESITHQTSDGHALLYTPIGGRITLEVTKPPATVLLYGTFNRIGVYTHNRTTKESWATQTHASHICISTASVDICAEARMLRHLTFEEMYKLAASWEAASNIAGQLHTSEHLHVIIAEGQSGMHFNDKVSLGPDQEWALDYNSVPNVQFWSKVIGTDAQLLCLHIYMRSLEMTWEDACELVSFDPGNADHYLHKYNVDNVISLSCYKSFQHSASIINNSLPPWKYIKAGSNTIHLTFSPSECKLSPLNLLKDCVKIKQDSTELHIENLTINEYEIVITFTIETPECVTIVLKSPDLTHYNSPYRYIFQDQHLSLTIPNNYIIPSIPICHEAQYCITDHIIQSNNITLHNNIFTGRGFCIVDSDILHLFHQPFTLQFKLMLSQGHTRVFSIGGNKRNEMTLQSSTIKGSCTLTLCIFDQMMQACILRTQAKTGSWLHISICVSFDEVTLTLNDHTSSIPIKAFAPAHNFTIGSPNMHDAIIHISHLNYSPQIVR